MTKAEYKLSVFSFLSSFTGEIKVPDALLPNEKAKPYFRQLFEEWTATGDTLVTLSGKREGKVFDYYVSKKPDGEAKKAEPTRITPSMIADLETFFNNATLPTEIQLDEHTKIVDVKKFVDKGLEVVKSNPSERYLPYYMRLCKVKELITV